MWLGTKSRQHDRGLGRSPRQHRDTSHAVSSRTLGNGRGEPSPPAGRSPATGASLPSTLEADDLPEQFRPRSYAGAESAAAEPIWTPAGRTASPDGVELTLRLPAVFGRVAWRQLAVPGLAFLIAAIYFAIRTMIQVFPEGDSTLHLHLMETVASGKLPKVVPYFAAIVGEGGQIEAYFPYSYTPLYHLFGGLVYKVGGERLVLMMGPLFAGASAIAIVFLLRGHPWPAAALAVALALLQWVTQPIFTWVYMDSMALALFLGGLCFYQRAWAGRSLRDAVLAGLFVGLAIGARQNAIFYAVFIAIHGGGTLAWDVLRGADRADLIELCRVYGAMAGTTILVALPFLGYLIWTTGTIGYGEFSLPGLPPSLPVDADANAYLTSFSTPLTTPGAWLEQYWHWTLFTSRWQLGLVSYLPLIPFCAGIAFLWTSPRAANRFLASYVLVHLFGEMTQLMTFHGNWRYVVASRVLFYVVVAVGIWYLVAWVYRSVKDAATWRPALTGVATAGFAVALMAPGFVTPGLIDYLVHQEASRTEKGESFKELGAYVDTYVPEDALLLSGRWYTTGYYLRRDYTWVTYFGNTWVIDAISDEDPATVRGLLDDHGIDYVVFQAPPPSYLDSMPSGGLRTIVLDDLEHFQLLFRNERTRLYRFWPEGIER